MTSIFHSYADYYDLLYETKDYRIEASYVSGLLNDHTVPVRNVLELGCGTGGHARELANLGYNVVGYDISPKMISKALDRIPSPLAEKLRFVVGDARIANEKRQYDAILSLFHVVSYQTRQIDVDALFSAVSKQLLDGGIFIFDFWYSPAVVHQKPEVRISRKENDAMRVTRIAEPVMKPSHRIVDVNYELWVEHKSSGALQRIQETHSMRHFLIPELAGLLRARGLECRAAYQWLSKAAPGTGSWSCCIIAVKRDSGSLSRANEADSMV